MAPWSKVTHLSDVRRAEPRAADDDFLTLALALRQGEAWAERAFFEQRADHVERILTRILGARSDLDDLVQEVFVRAFGRIEELREPRALPAWLTGIAVNVAREAIRAGRRRRWLTFMAPPEAPDLPATIAAPETRAAVRAFYQVVGELDADARIPFTLRFVEGMELAEIAGACGTSLSTIKRRIRAAEEDFVERARAHEALVDWLAEGTRWPR